jgi:hypothetical protein
MAHVGLTPQSVHAMGGYRVQGRGEEAARVTDQALALEKAGAFAIVLEAMPSELGSELTRTLQIPTIGIGAGPGTDAQVLVSPDLLGLSERIPKFARAYADLRGAEPGAPDGMKVDTAGNVYCGGAGGLYIIDPKGKTLGRIVHGHPETTNLAFGGDDWKTLFITTRHNLIAVKLKIAGVPVPPPKKS